MVGCAEGAREDGVNPCDVACVFLPRVTEASLDCVPFETCPVRYWLEADTLAKVLWSVLSCTAWERLCSA